MTHDELLAKIDKLETLDNKSIRYATAGIKTPITADTPTNKVLAKALRAVMELHKPTEPDQYLEEDEKYLICNVCMEFDENVKYPCPTIQAIEKELE